MKVYNSELEKVAEAQKYGINPWKWLTGEFVNIFRALSKQTSETGENLHANITCLHKVSITISLKLINLQQ